MDFRSVSIVSNNKQTRSRVRYILETLAVVKKSEAVQG